VMTGLDRRGVLEAVFMDNPEWAFLVRKSGRVTGYALARPVEGRIEIGPCVAEGIAPARELLQSLLSLAPTKKFRVCVPGKNTHAVRLATELGFTELPSSTRMYLGEKFEETEANYAMISPEKG